MARTDTIEVSGSKMRILVGEPAGDGPHPAVIVMCHIGGLDEFTEDRVDRLAAAGYVAAAPDLFHYHEWIAEKNERRASLRDKTIIDDVQATLAHLDATTATAPDKTAILGHCMGGRLALLGAGTIERFRAAIIYYGGRTMISWGDDGPTPFERIPSLKGPVLGFFGDLDTEPSPADVDKIEAELERHGIPAEFHRYADAGHAFQNFISPERHVPEAADDAWGKTIAFLDEQFG